jgi:hypothetical protein
MFVWARSRREQEPPLIRDEPAFGPALEIMELVKRQWGDPAAAETCYRRVVALAEPGRGGGKPAARRGADRVGSRPTSFVLSYFCTFVGICVQAARHARSRDGPVPSWSPRLNP